MLDGIITSLKDQVSGELLNKTSVKKEELPGIFDIVKEQATEKLGAAVAGGGLDSVMNLFSKNDNSEGANNIQSALSSGIVSGLASKLGFDSAKANSVVSMILPHLMKLITNKNDETDAGDSSFLEGMLGGGGASDLLGKAKGMFG